MVYRLEIQITQAQHCTRTYLSGFNISRKHNRYKLWPHWNTDVSLSKSNIESLPTIAKVPNEKAKKGVQMAATGRTKEKTKNSKK